MHHLDMSDLTNPLEAWKNVGEPDFKIHLERNKHNSVSFRERRSIGIP